MNKNACYLFFLLSAAIWLLVIFGNDNGLDVLSGAFTALGMLLFSPLCVIPLSFIAYGLMVAQLINKK